jgi:hypothetical protein
VNEAVDEAVTKAVVVVVVKTQGDIYRQLFTSPISIIHSQFVEVKQ